MVRPIMVTILGDDASLQRALARSSAATDSFGARMQAAGKRISGVGKTLTHNLTLPILGVGVAAVKMGVDFQKQMEMIHTQAGASQHEVNKLSKAVLQLAPSTTQGPGELAKALFHVESVGFRGAKAMNVLKVASQGAQIGQANLEETASALSAVTITNIKGTQNYQHAMAILNATIGAGNMRMTDLLEALKSGIVPTAKVAGLSLQGLAAALAMMTDEGVPAGIAANRLRTALLMMTNPTAKAQAALKSVGLNALDMAHQLQKPDGLVAALTLLRTHMESIHDPAKRLQLIGELFGGSRSAGTIALLLNNLDRVSMKYAQIGKTSSKFGADLAASNATASTKLSKAWSAITTALTKAGTALAPTFIKIADAVARAATDFSKLSTTQKDVVLFGLAAAAAAGPVLRMAGALVSIAGVAAKAGKAMGLFGTAAQTVAAAGAGEAAGGGGLLAGLGLTAGSAALIGGVVVGLAGLAYWLSTIKGGASAEEKAFNKIQAAIHGLSGTSKALAANTESAGSALRHMNSIIRETPNHLRAITKAQDAYEKLLFKGVGIQQKYAAQLATMKTGTDKLIASTRASLLPAGRFAGAAELNTQKLQAMEQHLVTTAEAEGRLAIKMQGSNPVLAANARHAAAVALAAAEVARRINAIPTFKQIQIQMNIDELINRYVGPVSGPPRGGTPGNPHGGRAGAHTASAGQPMHVHLYLDSKPIANALIKQSVMAGQPALRGT